MAGRGEDGEQLPVDEARRDELHVLQVAAAQIGIVHDPDVAGLETALRVGDLDHRLDGKLRVGEEDRQAVATLRDGLASHGMEDAVRAVVRLRDDRRERRMNEMEVHLVGNLLERAANNGKCHGIDHLALTSRLPAVSTVRIMPGSTTVVVSA